MTTSISPSGLDLIHSEMARQGGDALATLAAQDVQGRARQVADAARRSGRLLLLGMGASHAANRMAEVPYRLAGLDATAMPLSEALYQPLPQSVTQHHRTELIASQSGASGEVLRALELPGGETQRSEIQRFGLTLDAASPLARTLPSLVGVGGVERGFAATRSLVVSLALHACVLEHLGVSSADLVGVLRSPPQPELQAAVSALAQADTLILSGRAELTGVAEVCALHAAELSRVPALALEGGQFRHGPVELLRPGLGVVLLRAAGPSAALTGPLVQICLDAGVTPVVFDVSGEAALAGTVTVALPPATGLAAALLCILPLQQLLLDFAAARVERVGEPRHARKVTLEA
jgi:fructoselysine-6-P-deglycase FrlB-like protein